MKKFDVLRGVWVSVKCGWEPYGMREDVTYLKREASEAVCREYQNSFMEELLVQRQNVARLAAENKRLQSTICELVALDDAVANSRSQLQKENQKLKEENEKLARKSKRNAELEKYCNNLRTQRDAEAAENRKLKEENKRLERVVIRALLDIERLEKRR